jgi:hypothetical protein
MMEERQLLPHGRPREGDAMFEANVRRAFGTEIEVADQDQGGGFGALFEGPVDGPDTLAGHGATAVPGLAERGHGELVAVALVSDIATRT